MRIRSLLLSACSLIVVGLRPLIPFVMPPASTTTPAASVIQRISRGFRLAPWPLVAFLLVATFIGVYYRWCVRSTGNQFDFHRQLDGYYNYLSQGFAAGQLHLLIKPAPELLALSNPWDPEQNLAWRVHDMVLHHGRLYLYHGPGPAVMLFLPWRLLTGWDLPENFATFLFCFGAFLCWCGALWRVLRSAGVTPGPWLLGLMVFALGTCNGVPYLLNRVHVYETAIAGGQFCLAAGFLCFVSGLAARHPSAWMAAGGFCLGLSIACRPHLGLAGAVAFAALLICYLLRRLPRMTAQLVAFALPFLFAGGGMALYNYARFQNPFEFGIRYMLADRTSYQQIDLAWGHLLPGLYFLLLCPPDFTLVFPFVRLIFRYPFDWPGFGFPPDYFYEFTVGLLWTTPLLAGVALLPFAFRRFRQVPVALPLIVSAVASLAILLFLAGTNLMSQRFQVDFQPLALWLAAVCASLTLSRLQGLGRSVLLVCFTVAIVYGAVVNAALGVAGPYHGILRQRPPGFVRLASMFSIDARHRPVLNPPLEIAFTARFKPLPYGVPEPLLSIGQEVHGYFLFAEHHGDRMLVYSRCHELVTQTEIDLPQDRTVRFDVSFSPATMRMQTRANGRVIQDEPMEALVTAPAQIRPGENRVDINRTPPRFSGELRLARMSPR